MAAKILVSRNVKETKLFLDGIQRKFPTRIGQTMTSISEDVKRLAKEILSDALYSRSNGPSYGSTGLLVSSIEVQRFDAGSRARSWKVFIAGAAAEYADQIESAAGLPMDVPSTGNIRNWKSRVEDATGKYVPVRNQTIRVGAGTHPASIYTEYPTGVRFMEQAFNQKVDELSSEIDSTINNILR